MFGMFESSKREELLSLLRNSEATEAERLPDTVKLVDDLGLSHTSSGAAVLGGSANHRPLPTFAAAPPSVGVSASRPGGVVMPQAKSATSSEYGGPSYQGSVRRGMSEDGDDRDREEVCGTPCAVLRVTMSVRSVILRVTTPVRA